MENLEVDSMSNPKCSATESSALEDPNAVEAKNVIKVEALPEIIRILELRSRESNVSMNVSPTEEKPAVNPLASSKSNIEQSKPFHPDNPPSTDNTYFLRGLPKPTSNSEDNEDLLSDLNLYKRISNGSYSCELCTDKRIENICKDKTQIFRHLLRAHTHCQTYECSCCQLTFDDHSAFENHKQDEHYNLEKCKAKYIQCDRCEHRSKNKNLLRLHLLRRHAVQHRYVCKCCAKCFKTWKIKHDHEKAMEQNNKRTAKKIYKREFVCDKCDKILAPKSELIKHMKSIHLQDFKKVNRVLYECTHCTRYFLTRKSLMKHSPICHKPLENDSTGFSCPNCDKKLSSKDHLKKHALVHSGERPHVCPECGQTFALLNTMKVHALSHYNIKPYACDICGLNYSQRSALMTHWKSKHKNLPAPGPVEIHQFFDEEGKIVIPCDYEEH